MGNNKAIVSLKCDQILNWYGSAPFNHRITLPAGTIGLLVSSEHDGKRTVEFRIEGRKVTITLYKNEFQHLNMAEQALHGLLYE